MNDDADLIDNVGREIESNPVTGCRIIQCMMGRPVAPIYLVHGKGDSPLHYRHSLQQARRLMNRKGACCKAHQEQYR